MLAHPLRDLRAAIEAVPMVLDLDGSHEARRDAAELVDQIDDYLVPRLERLDAPLLAVLGGSTGAGKSTITNSLVGEEVTAAGVLRPTTRRPVLVCASADLAWFSEGGVLDDLARTSGSDPVGATGLRLATAAALPPGLALLDAPDIDSVEVANHALAAQLLGAADLWLFVTTAARYADAVPWEYLRRARERSIALAIIVNRIPGDAEAEVLDHLQSMLVEHGLGGATVFGVTEGELADGRIGEAVEPVRRWLLGLVGDAETRQRVIRRSLDGALDSIPPRVGRLADQLARQAASVESLRSLSHHQYADALDSIDRELDAGNLLRGEVLDRWREHVGTGAFMERLQHGVSRLRDRLRSIVSGSPPPPAQVRGQLESNLEILVRQAADQAALSTVEGWERLPGGSAVLVGSERGIDRATSGLSARLTDELTAWEQAVLGIVRDQAGSRVAVARTLSLGINGVGVALMVAVFSHTGGLTGGEAVVAGGTAAVSQTVLTAVFGEQAVRDLARRARDDLRVRLDRLFVDEHARFDTLLDAVPDAGQITDLVDAAAAVEAARQ